MALDSRLLSILVDPQDKQPLYYLEDESFLYNPRTHQRYEVREGDIPVLLSDEAQEVDAAEHTRLMTKIETEGLAFTVVPKVRMNDQPGKDL